jgi:glucose-1-phosphate cytidylyltransferase
MKVVILAGGYGTRLSEETVVKPKPMVEIGGKPILWHIMKIYSHYGFNDFIIPLGYKGYFIKEYFANYFLHQSDVSIDLASNKIDILHNTSDPWKVTLIDTGYDTNTGGRVNRIKKYVENETFMLTYGDGVADINITELIAFHKTHGKSVTMTAIQPEGRYGAMDIEEDNKVSSFIEKPKGDNAWVNGGFFVCQPDVFDYIPDDSTSFESVSLKKLAAKGLLYTYKHKGYWKCMDTLRDKNHLNELWSNNNAKWKIWE